MLQPWMRLVFEVSHLRHATPATVSRAGVLYLEADDVGWRPFITSWIQTHTSANPASEAWERNLLGVLFDQFLPNVLDGMQVLRPVGISPMKATLTSNHSPL